MKEDKGEDICLLIKDRRVNTCPIANKIAKDAAEKTAREIFLRFGYDLDDPKDIKKLTLLFDFMETVSNNVKKGKIIVGSTVLKLVITAIIGATVLEYFNRK